MNGDCLYTVISLGLLIFIVTVMAHEEDKRVEKEQVRRLLVSLRSETEGNLMNAPPGVRGDCIAAEEKS